MNACSLLLQQPARHASVGAEERGPACWGAEHQQGPNTSCTTANEIAGTTDDIGSMIGLFCV